MNSKNGSLSRAMRNRALEIVFNFNGDFSSELITIYGKEFSNQKIDFSLCNWISTSSIANELSKQASLVINQHEEMGLKTKIEWYF